MNYQEWQTRYPEAAAALASVVFAPVDAPNNSLTEQAVQQECRFLGAGQGMWLLRNNSGAFTDKVKLPPGVPRSPANILAAIVKKYKGLRWGLGNDSSKINAVMKSPDLVGGTEFIIPPHWVGRKVCVATFIEVKDPDWSYNPKDAHQAAQAACMNKVIAMGGLAGFVTNAAQLEVMKQEYMK